jgi:hypothetical protein
MSEATVIHFVRGLAPGHTPLCGAESSMGSFLPRLVTCPACKTRLENPLKATVRATPQSRRPRRRREG